MSKASKFNRLIGSENIVLIHFNDSGRELDSHVDSHANVGIGLIGIEGLTEVAKWAKAHGVAVVCETPGIISPLVEMELIEEMVA